MESAKPIEQPAQSAADFALLRYFAGLKLGKLVLWCYLIWYVVMVSFYFEPSLRLWLSSLGISAIIGFALILSTTAGWKDVRAMDRWQMMRLFLMPFCVSSFAAMIKGREFVLFFSPRLTENAIAASACLGFCLLVFALKRVTRRAAGPVSARAALP